MIASKTGDKLARFRYGPDSTEGPTVTTHISANPHDLKMLQQDEEDIGFEGGKFLTSSAGRSFPLERLKVQVNQVVEVDTGSREGRDRGSMASTPMSVNDEERKSHRSTEELFESD